MLKWAIVFVGSLVFAVEKYGADEVTRQLPFLRLVVSWLRSLHIVGEGPRIQTLGDDPLDGSLASLNKASPSTSATHFATGEAAFAATAAAPAPATKAVRLEDIAPPALCRYWRRRRERSENPDKVVVASEAMAAMRARRRKAAQASERHKRVRERIENSRHAEKQAQAPRVST